MGYKIRLKQIGRDLTYIEGEKRIKHESDFAKRDGEVSIVTEQENEDAFVCSKDAT